MSVTVSVAGSNYTIPQTKERGWGANVTSWIQAISSNTLQKNGGNFTLTADTNFGSSFGLLAKYFTSVSSNPAASGVFRLANAESVGWRNAANSADVLLTVNASNQLTFNGNQVLDATIGLSNPMATTGDTIYGGVSGVATKLVGNTTATKKFLTQTGNGSVSAAPGWNTIVDGDLPTSQAGKTFTSTVNLTGGSNLANAEGAFISSTATAGRFNYLFGANYSSANTFEITPSTAANGSTYSTPALSVAQTSAQFTSTSAMTLKLQAVGGSGNQQQIYFLNSAASGKTNFAIGNQIVSSNEFEIIPSTAVDGTTFSNPGFKMDNIGNCTLGSTASSSHTIQNSSTTGRTLNVQNASSSTSADGLAAILITKGSATTTTSQQFILFGVSSGGTLSGSIVANGASTAAFATASDRNIKKNITPINGALAQIGQLQPVQFEYVDKVKHGDGTQKGFVAQDLQTVFPENVGTAADGTLFVAGWSKEMAILVRAIQELKAEIDALKKPKP